MFLIHRHAFRFVILAFGLLLALSASGQAPPRYAVTRLNMTSVDALNNISKVVGQDANGNTLLYDYLAKTYTNLGAIGTVVGINDSGQMAGNTSPTYPNAPFLYTNGVFTSLAIPPNGLGNYFESAAGLNNAGQVVGTGEANDPWGVEEDGESQVIYVYDNGVLYVVSGLVDADYDYHPTAVAINNQSISLAQTFYFGDGYGSYDWIGSSLYPLADESESGAPPGIAGYGPVVSFLFGTSYSGAYSITGLNDNNDDVGYWTTSANVIRAFLSNTLDLGTLGGANSYAFALNNATVVVGKSDVDTNSPPTEHAFLYQSGAMYDLNVLLVNPTGWVLNSAVKINNAGYIIGTGTYNGAAVTFLLSPTVPGAHIPPHPGPGATHSIGPGTGGLTGRAP